MERKEIITCIKCKYRWLNYKNSQNKCKAGELIYFISDTEHRSFDGKCSKFCVESDIQL